VVVTPPPATLGEGSLQPPYPHPTFPPLGVGGIANNPMYGRTGPYHPLYGIVPTNAMTINVNSPDGKLIQSFSSRCC